MEKKSVVVYSPLNGHVAFFSARFFVESGFTEVSFQFQIIRDFVDFALPCYLYCPRLVFTLRMIWKWNQVHCVHDPA
jgi:hypothetical protein